MRCPQVQFNQLSAETGNSFYLQYVNFLLQRGQSGFIKNMKGKYGLYVLVGNVLARERYIRRFTQCRAISFFN